VTISQRCAVAADLANVFFFPESCISLFSPVEEAVAEGPLPRMNWWRPERRIRATYPTLAPEYRNDASVPYSSFCRVYTGTPRRRRDGQMTKFLSAAEVCHKF